MQTVTLVGIVNLTPDSFSDGGQYYDATKALKHIDSLFTEGAELIDIGAESTRPNADALTPAKEWLRLEPVLRHVYPKYPGKISIDSYHPETIERIAHTFGPVIANDVTGFNNPKMVEIVARYQLPCIISHLPRVFGSDIQAAHASERPLSELDQVRTELLQRYDEAIAAGIPKKGIILDPGIGFGKTMELNRQLLEVARVIADIPILIGYSRKRFLGEHRLDIDPNLNAAKTAIAAGARYLRVHDVKPHAELLKELDHASK